MDNTTNKHWFENKRFDSFWENYNQNFDQRGNVAFASYYKCFSAMKQASYAAQIMATRCTEEFKKTLDVQENSEYAGDLEQEPADTVGSEIDEDFLKFYEESLKYKRDKKAIEKKKLKQMQDEGISVEHVSGEQVDLNRFKASKSAPLQRAGVEREEELMILYGKENAQEIHLVETKLQMKFDKNLDLYQPVYWPSFPLRIAFD